MLYRMSEFLIDADQQPISCTLFVDVRLVRRFSATSSPRTSGDGISRKHRRGSARVVGIMRKSGNLVANLRRQKITPIGLDDSVPLVTRQAAMTTLICRLKLGHVNRSPPAAVRCPTFRAARYRFRALHGGDVRSATNGMRLCAASGFHQVSAK